MSRNIISGMVLVLGVAVLGGGIAAAVTGEREFHVHEVHHDDDARVATTRVIRRARVNDEHDESDEERRR